jgi:cyanate permease
LNSNEKVEGYRWVILTIVYLSILAFTFIFQSIPPILPLIISELQLTYAQSGLLMSLPASSSPSRADFYQTVIP